MKTRKYAKGKLSVERKRREVEKKRGEGGGNAGKKVKEKH